MERLAKENINTPAEYDRIYSIRESRGINSQDLKRWKRLIKYYHGGSILDVGCLDSAIPSLVANPSEYWGVDVAKECIEKMSVKHPQSNFCADDVYDLHFDNGIFSYVVLGEVIEHLENPERAIKESIRVLKDKGILAISTPLEERLEPGAVDGDRHLWSFSVDDLFKLLRPYGKVRKYILGSQYWPTYQYHWPTLIVYCKKNGI